MPTRHRFEELLARPVDAVTRKELERAGSELHAQLRLGKRQAFSFDGESVRFENLIGSFGLPGGDSVEVSPKVSVEENWAPSVVQLLEPNTPLAVTGAQRSSPTVRRRDLTGALALEYARRLERALRTEGPLQVYERRSTLSSRLNGRLDVGRWLRTSIVSPARFPVTRDELTVDNEFARGLSIIAGALSRSAAGSETSARLRRLQTAVIPGAGVPSYVSPAVARRALPSQWVRYRPAWDIAAALLRSWSVLGKPGQATGLEVAVTPWPLLETLLERSLRRIASDGGFIHVPKRKHDLLAVRGTGSIAQRVEPDGLLQWPDGTVAASFEAKYTRQTETPKEAHLYQALTTAAVVRSPLAVLVYAGETEPRWFDVHGFGGYPARVATIGLGLFTYEAGVGDATRARRLHHLIAAASSRTP
ncbi:5-methylcytosine restriction system specificity protein McrC [Microbacterium sp. USHLN186]|uniref:5-methylcytosine restriction system specificity protein McrC n=1 Tax=Microbacterium sp. USHLN186 TaxID=3081286 RepID=UPI00301A618A